VVALMFLALANARSVSPSASYLKIGMPHHHQVTKCPCSWLGPTSSGTFTQVASCVVWDIAHLEAKSISRSTANTAVRLDPIPVGDAGGHDGSEAVGQ
jgi:hypothetical protein